MPTTTYQNRKPTRLADKCDPTSVSTNRISGRLQLFFHFSIIAATVLSYFLADKRLYLLLRRIPDFVVLTAELVTRFGLAGPYLIGSSFLFIVFRWIIRRRMLANRALLVMLSVSLGGAFNAILKFVFGRYRPKAFFRDGLYGFSYFETKYMVTSFPSGHSNTAAAVTVALCLIFPKYRTVFLAAGLLTVLSRLALGVHYLSDVIFGAYLGGITAYWVSVWMRRKGLSYQPNS